MHRLRFLTRSACLAALAAASLALPQTADGARG